MQDLISLDVTGSPLVVTMTSVDEIKNKMESFLLQFKVQPHKQRTCVIAFLWSARLQESSRWLTLTNVFYTRL